MREEKIAMVINTPDASGTADSFSIRRTALEMRLPFFTTMAGAQAAVEGIAALKDGRLRGARAAGLSLDTPDSGGRNQPPRIADRRAYRRAPRIPVIRPRAMPLEMQTPLSALSGVGPKRAAALADRGIATVADLLFNLPLHYQDWRMRTPVAELKPGTNAVVEGRLAGFKERPMRGMRWRRMATGWLEGAGGARLRVVWFNLPAYMKGRMPGGERVVMHGRVSEAPGGGLEIIHPEVYPLDSGAPPAVRPVYGLPSGDRSAGLWRSRSAGAGGARRTYRGRDAGRVARGGRR